MNCQTVRLLYLKVTIMARSCTLSVNRNRKRRIRRSARLAHQRRSPRESKPAPRFLFKNVRLAKGARRHFPVPCSASDIAPGRRPRPCQSGLLNSTSSKRPWAVNTEPGERESFLPCGWNGKFRTDRSSSLATKESLASFTAVVANPFMA